MKDASFGRWVEHRRRSLLLTREQLAFCAACSAATIRKIEADERRPSPEVAKLLADCLQVDPDERPAFIRFARGESSSQRPSPLQAQPHSTPWRGPKRGLTNLPAATTSWIGRERECRAVAELLGSPSVRLVTLTGPGGIGKTQLALHVAADVKRHFVDGVVFVVLAPITDPEIVATTIAKALEVNEASASPVAEILARYLQEKHLLLVLDNLEQVAGAAPLIGALLRSVPGLKVLATSRALLHLYGEHEYSVPPLALPDVRHQPRLAELAQTEAIQLFIERVRAVKPDFQLTESNAPAIVEICRRVDALPLAIELAAARCKLFSPDSLAARLSRPLALLTGGPRDLPERHQTLRNTIEWSYQLLPRKEQALFSRLAVFAGEFTLNAVETVCAPNSETLIDAIEGLTELIDNSLVHQIMSSDSEPRFAMLETIRQYALERLERSEEYESLLDRHAAYYVALVERAEPERVGAQQVAWLTRLEQEHANIRATLAHLVKRQQVEQSIRMVGALQWFWQIHGHLTEGRRYVELVLRNSDGADPGIVAKVLKVGGALATIQNDLVEAKSYYEAGLAIATRLHDEGGIAVLLNNLGTVAQYQGAYTEAVQRYEEALMRYSALNDRTGMARALNNRGMVARDMKEYGSARRMLEECLVLRREAGDTWGIANTLNNLGQVAREQGDITAARALFLESLRLNRELREQVGTAYVLEDLAVLLAETEPEHTLQLAGAAEAIRAGVGAPRPVQDTERLERAVEAAHRALGFTSGRDDGRAMTFEQAVDYALALEH